MEFSIWGIPPGETLETLLCEFVRGERITDRALANAVKLEAEKRGNSKVRIMALDLASVDVAAMFRGAVKS